LLPTKQNIMNGKSGHDKQHTKGGLEKRTRSEKK
jgi:hypothetical protein